MRRSLLWQLYPAVLLLVLAALAIVYLYVTYYLHRFYEAEKRLDLEVRAQLVRTHAAGFVQTGRKEALDDFCKRMGEEIRTRITLIDANGKVLGESRKDPEVMENHLLRPEIQQALSGQTGFHIRPSTTLRQTMMYVAIPLLQDGAVIGIVRTAEPISKFEAALSDIQHKIIVSGLLLALVLAGVSWLVCWTLSRPLGQMRRGAQRFAAGDLGHRLAIGGNREMADLAESLNQMAEELSRRIETITSQRNEQQAVLSSMTEGVLAVDVHHHCLSINQAAVTMLQVAAADPCGRTVPEIIRNRELQEFIERSLDNPDPSETRVVLYEGSQERHVQAHGTALLNGQGQRIGSLIVLNDITEIHKLQMLRTDFVANVSHELKTPVTSIKGFVETLLEGAKDRPSDLQRFLEIIQRQTERLNSIIDDLLTLSRIEQQTEKSQIPFEQSGLREIVLESAELCRYRAEQKKISVEIDCPESLRAHVNPSLLEQALVNLIDNAVKYSQPGGAVSVRVVQQDQEIRIEVADHGCGIANEHLPRLFERFYRVDKARSRTLGGTGLGLAIVKHIAQAHAGQVLVESTPGTGSLFTLVLPMNAETKGHSSE